MFVSFIYSDINRSVFWPVVNSASCYQNCYFDYYCCSYYDLLKFGRYGNLKEKKAVFLEDIATYGDAFLLLPAFSFRANTGASFKVYDTLKEFKARQKVIFFHPKYLKNLALFWRTKGVTEYRLSSGLMITSVAVELCENVKLYGFWPFSKTVEDTPVSHHYYDNNLPKRGFHEMPKEYRQILQLHVKGILKLQFSKCEIA